MIVSSVSWVDFVSLILLPIGLPALVGLVTNAKWPTLGKRLTLGGLSLATTVLTNLVEAFTTNTPYDIGWGLLQFAATWGLAELVYYGILKAPIAPATTEVMTNTPIPVDDYTKGQLISLAEAVTGVTPSSKLDKPTIGAFIDGASAIIEVQKPAVTLASILATKGVK